MSEIAIHREIGVGFETANQTIPPTTISDPWSISEIGETVSRELRIECVHPRNVENEIGFAIHITETALPNCEPSRSFEDYLTGAVAFDCSEAVERWAAGSSDLGYGHYFLYLPSRYFVLVE